MLRFAPLRWIRLGLAAGGAFVLATTARSDWDDRSRPFSLDSGTMGPVLSASSVMPEQDALTMVGYFNELWSEDGLTALPEIRSMYADQVEFYGSVVSVDDVMADKVALAERWAERDYSLDLAASIATCASPTSCLVEGEVVWGSRTLDGTRRSGGRARVLMGLERINGRFRIVREEGEVLERD